jgi:predicted metalloprotease
MRWRGRRESQNVEDRRGVGPKVAVGGLGLVVVLVLAMCMGADPMQLLRTIEQTGGGPGAGGAARPASPEEDELAGFVKVVLADTEDVWNELFRQRGRRYEEPRLVLFTGRVSSACGLATAAVGPFYCPADKQVYIDLGFYRQLKDRLGAPGDFAQAYVIAHEVGHHVQNLLGISDRVHRLQQRVGQAEANALSVRLELQADFFAGVWAHHAQRTKQILEHGDIEEAMRAADAIGDDTLQRQGTGTVRPDSFTHGTSAQRVAWFTHGLRTGDLAQGDTFDDELFARINPR